MPVSKKILLVDDNPIVLEMMGKALSNEGFNCLKAASADAAMQILKLELPDIILSDYHMPNVDGFAFRHNLITIPKYKDIPFMFLTSEADAAIMLKGVNLEAVDYILKDTPIPVVVTKINNFLSTVREQHERTLKELSVAAIALNLNSIPQKLPVINGFDVDFWHKDFHNYPGGDFIDFITIDERYTFVVLGDVMGKKWGAWYFSFGFLSYVRAAVRICISDKIFSTKSILQKINNVVYLDPVVGDVLSSLSLIMIDSHESTITYTGAGDLPLLYYNAINGGLKQIHSSGMLLGLMQNGNYDETILKLNVNDKVYLFTDGIIDFEGEDGKKTDYNTFITAITPYFNKPFTEFKKSSFLQEKVLAHIDDCSLIYLQKTQ